MWKFRCKKCDKFFEVKEFFYPDGIKHDTCSECREKKKWNKRCTNCGRFISKKRYAYVKNQYIESFYSNPVSFIPFTEADNYNFRIFCEKCSGLNPNERKENEKNNSPLAEWSSIWPTPRRKRFDSFRGYQKIKQKIKHFLLKFIFPELDD